MPLSFLVPVGPSKGSSSSSNSDESKSSSSSRTCSLLARHTRLSSNTIVVGMSLLSVIGLSTVGDRQHRCRDRLPLPFCISIGK